MWAWKQRHQPHLRRLIPRPRTKETTALEFKVGICDYRPMCLFPVWFFETKRESYVGIPCRQEKETWIKAKYVEKKFLKKLGSTEILINGERKSERPWRVKKCRRHNSASTAPKTRRRYRPDPGRTSPSTLSSGIYTDLFKVPCMYLQYFSILSI